MRYLHFIAPALALALVAVVPFAPFSPRSGAAETDANPTPPPAQSAPQPFLGVRFDSNSVAMDQQAGIPINDVVPGSTAQQLGLQPGDQLVSINGAAIEKMDDLKTVLAGSKVGDRITVVYLRGGQSTTVGGVLSERPKPGAVGAEVQKLGTKLDEVKELAEAKKREPSLAEILQQIKDIEAGLPRAVAAFKQQYPNGEFDIRIQVVITSDKNAANPLELGNGMAKPEAKGRAEDKKDDGKKPDEKKPDEAKPDPAKAPTGAPPAPGAK